MSFTKAPPEMAPRLRPMTAEQIAKDIGTPGHDAVTRRWPIAAPMPVPSAMAAGATAPGLANLTGPVSVMVTCLPL